MPVFKVRNMAPRSKASIAKPQVSLIIFGCPESKANSRKIVTFRGRPASIKSQKARNYEASAICQIPPSARVGFTSPVGVSMVIHYNRRDLDESLILDIMQKAGVFKNDRLVHAKEIVRGYNDPKKPRSIVTVWELPKITTATQEHRL
jgi:Holliday junction resolvase RusA-like endonuclease